MSIIPGFFPSLYSLYSGKMESFFWWRDVGRNPCNAEFSPVLFLPFEAKSAAKNASLSLFLHVRDQQTTQGLQPVSLNKVLLEHSPTPYFTDCLGLLSCTTVTELRSYSAKGNHRAYKHSLVSGPLQKQTHALWHRLTCII